MNLHINLLLESERRSSSRISRKFLVKASVACAALLLFSLVVVALSGARSARQRCLFVEQEKKQLEPAFRAVTELRRELTDLQDMTNAIMTWAQTRPDWPGLLAGIQSVVPANVQLTRLTVNENITLIDNLPTRVVTLFLQGKAAGEHSETDVQELEKSLKEKPPFNAVMELAQVKQFEAVKNGGQQDMRIFDIECRFKPLKLFQPVKVQTPDVKQDNKK